MPASNAATETRREFQEKQARLAEVMQMAEADGGRYDLGRKSVLEKLGVSDRNAALDKVKEWNRELDDLGVKLEQHEAMEVAEAMAERERARNTPARGGEHVHADPGALDLKSPGQLFVGTKQYRETFRRDRQPAAVELDISMKTLFQTGTGFLPESTRSGLVVEKADQSLAELLDLIPVFPLTQAAFVYMEETVRTHGATEKAEGAQYAESEFSYTERTSTAKKVTDSIPATDEQLEDEGTVASLLDQRLRYGLRKRAARQILVGDGIGANLLGILATPNIQTQAKGSDAVMAAAFKALTKVRFTGDADPSAFVFHPNDWQDGIVLAQELSGPFIWGHPAMVPMTRLWGLPVALSTGITENTALAGDFRNFSRLDEKKGVTVEIGYIDKQFVEGKKTMRAELRTAFTVTRPAAFCQITGI